MMTYTPQANKSLTTQINGGNLSPYASQALQMLSLHLPQFLGGMPVAPESLLQASPNAGLMSSLQGQLGAPSGASLGSAPPPVMGAAPGAAPPPVMGAMAPSLGAAPSGGGSPLGALATAALSGPPPSFASPSANAPQTPSITFGGGNTNRQDIRVPGPGIGAVMGPGPRPGVGAAPVSSTMPMPTAALMPNGGTPNLAGLASALSGLFSAQGRLGGGGGTFGGV